MTHEPGTVVSHVNTEARNREVGQSEGKKEQLLYNGKKSVPYGRVFVSTLHHVRRGKEEIGVLFCPLQIST